MSDPVVVAAFAFAVVIAVGGLLVFVYDLIEARLPGAGQRRRLGPGSGWIPPRRVRELVPGGWRVASPSAGKTSAPLTGRSGSVARRF